MLHQTFLHNGTKEDQKDTFNIVMESLNRAFAVIGGIIMNKVLVTLSLFFEDPFWIGVVEKVTDGKLSACKITFGAEPKDYEVYDFLLKNYYKLQFSPTLVLL